MRPPKPLFPLFFILLGSILPAESRAQVRSIDGFGNHLANPAAGTAGTPYLRCGPTSYGDGISSLVAGPNPRDVSNAVHAQPSSSMLDSQRSDYVWIWGQFLDHDLGLAQAGSVAAPIAITAPGDPLSPGPIPFTRNTFAPGTGTGGTPAQQINEVTAFLDGSVIYGSDAVRATALRTGSSGLLTTSAGGLPMFNTTGLANDNPTPAPATSMFFSGDVRTNENVALTAMHTVWIREHNRIANDLAVTNPGWGDQQIFDQARSIVVGEMQAVTYQEYLPALMGDLAPDLGSLAYDPTITPGLANEFATAAFRLGHTQVSPQLKRVDNAGSSLGDLSLADAFFRPDHYSTANPFSTGSAVEIDYLLKGASVQHQQATDAFIVDELRNMLFGPPGAGGMDLAALNIQRGRDHGLMSYNDARTLFGLTPASVWADVTSDLGLQASLGSVYGSPADLELWTGLLAEDPLFSLGAVGGETLNLLLNKQFSNLVESDRFFFLWDPALDPSTREEILSTRLSDIVLRNTDIDALPTNLFLIPEPSRSLLLAFGLALALLRRSR